MAKLILAREEKLTNKGFFTNRDEVLELTGKLEKLSKNFNSKSLRWQLGIDDDILDPEYRCVEFHNFVKNLVTPRVS